MTTILATLALTLATTPSRAEWVDWIADAEALYGYDNNVNRAPTAFSDEQRSGRSWSARARGGRVFQFGGTTRLAASGEIRGEIYDRWRGLDIVAGDGQLSLFHKFGLGPAPWARISFSGGYQSIHDDPRSGAIFLVGADIGKRFSPRFDATLHYLYTDRQGGDGAAPPMSPLSTDVFTQQSHTLTIEGNFLLTEHLLLSPGFSYRRGDFDSNIQSVGWRAVLALEKDVKAAAVDNVFGGIVYRISGNTYSPFVSVNYGFTDRFSVDAGYRYERGEGSSLKYDNRNVHAAAIFRF